LGKYRRYDRMRITIAEPLSTDDYNSP
jgi:hypothetical protein